MKYNNIHWDELEIDSRIIPLFRSHIQVKKKHLLKKNNYDLNLIIPKKLKLINEVIPLNVKLVKIYNLINNYSLIINNLYLKNDILKALPSEDKLKVKMSLDSIALKLKLFEPIFRFKSLNFENYLKKKKFKSLFQSETHFLLRSLFFKKNVKVNEENLNNKKKVENNKKSSNIVSPTYNSKLLGLKPNFIKPTTKNKIKKTEGTETISAALKEIKGEGYKGKERDIKKKNNTSLINKVEKDNFVDFVKNSSDTLKKIKKIKKEISIQKQKKKNLFSLYFNNSIYPYKSNISNIQPDMLGEREKGLIKGVKKIKTYKNLKSLIKLNYLDLAIKLGLESGNTKIIYTNLFADRFLKKRLGPKPRKNKDLALDSKLYTHKIRTPIDRNKFLYHRKLENKIANKNPRIRYWYNHTVKPFTTPSQTLVEGKRERGENLILNKYINLRNTFTKTSYKTISKPLNIKIKNTLLNSLMIHNNLKNKNILNKFYKFKILNNHKKYFLWKFLYKNSKILNKKYNTKSALNHEREHSGVEQGKKMNKFSNNLNSKPLAIDLLNTSLDLSTLLKNNVSWEGKDKEELNFKILWNNLSFIARLIILWELKENSHLIQLFNYFNKKKINKDISNNFNKFFYKYLYINKDKNKFFENIKPEGARNWNARQQIYKINNNKLRLASPLLLREEKKRNLVKTLSSIKMKLKYLKLQLIFYSKYKDVKRKLKERANNQRKIINERKKGNMLNKKKKKVTSWKKKAYKRGWIAKYARFKNKKLAKKLYNKFKNTKKIMYRAKPIYNKLISNFKIKISLPVREEVSKEDKILKNLSLNQTKSVFLQSSNKIRNSQSENFVITLSSFFSMLRKEFKNNSSVEHSYKHPISIKPRTLTQFGRKIYLKTSASAIPFYLIVRNKGIEKNKIKKLKFKLFNNKKVRSNFQSHSPRFRYHSQNSLKGGLFKPEIKGTAKEETGVEGIISKDNNYYNFDKHIKKVEKGLYENHKTTTFKKSIGNNFISSGKENKVKNYKFQFNNYAKNRKIRSKIAKFKLIEPFQARNFVDFIKDKNKKLIIKEMFKSLNNIKNEINLIDLKKKEEKLKIKIDRLIAKARKKIIIFTIIELFKKINFFKFTKKEKLIYPANTFYIFYFKKEFELMLSNFFKAGVSISEFNLPDKAYIDINSNYKKDNSQPIKEINLKKIVNTKGSTAISNILNSKRVDGEVNTINTIKGLEIDSKKRLRIFNILNLPYHSLPKSLMKKSLRRKQLLRKNLKKKLIFTKIKKLIRNPKKNQTLIPLLTNTKKAAPLVKRVVKNINQEEKSYGDKNKNYKILSRELGGKKKKKIKIKKKNVVLIRYNKIKKNQNITPFSLGKVKIFKPSVYIHLAKPFYSQHLKVKELGSNKKGKIKKEGKKAVKIKQQTRSPKLNITNKVSVKVQKKIKINEKSKDISNVVIDKEERLQSSYLAYLFKKSKHYYSKKSNLNVNIDIVENKFIFSYKYININQLLVKSIKKKIDINKPTFKDNLINNKEIDSSLGENINSIETTLNVKKEVLNKVNNKKIIKSYAQSSAHAPEGEGLKLKNKAPFNIKGGRGVLLKGKDNKTKPFSQGLGRKKKNKYKLKKQKSLGAWLKKIANLKKKKQYVKDLNNYKFVIMKRNKKKEQLFRKLYSLKKRIRLKKIIIPVNTNRIKNKFNKNYMLRKFPTPILGRREEINLLNNSAKENKINMVKWIKWRIIKIKNFDWKISTVVNKSPVDIIYFKSVKPRNNTNHSILPLSEKDLRTESDQRNKDNSKNLFTAPLYTSPINSLSPYLTDKEDGEIIKKKEKEQPIIHYYLKSMSIFNRIFKGSFVFFNKFVGFNFNHANNFNKFRENIYKFLFFSFKKMFSLISKPVFVITPDKVVIHLFYFILIPTLLKNKIIKKKNKKKNKMVKVTKKIFNCVAINNNSKNNNNPGPIETWGKIKGKRDYSPKTIASNYRNKKKIKLFKKLHNKNKIKLKKLVEISLIKMYPKKFEKLCSVLSKFLKKNIEFNLIRLHYPYNDSHILANYLALVINKLKFVLLTRKIFRYAIIKKLSKLFIRNKFNIIPSFLTGLKMKVAGRLMNYKVIPRKTVKLRERGSSSPGTVNYTSFSRVTSKNRRGAYSITVSSGQNFF